MINRIDSVVNYLLAYYNGKIQNIYNTVDNDYKNEFHLTNVKLQQLLYYCQGVHLAYEEKTIFDENIILLQYGPGVLNVYNQYKHFSDKPIEYIEELEFLLNDLEKETIRFVVDNFGCYTEWHLVNEIHKEGTPCSTAIKTNDKLDIKEIKQYFKDNIVEVSQKTNENKGKINMKILKKLNADIITAMKNKDKERLAKLKTIKSEIDLGIKEGRIDNDANIVILLNSTLKKYHKSIELAGESDYANNLREDVKIINDLIPEEFKSKSITKEETFSIMNENNLDNMGAAMKYFKENNYDMKAVNGFVKEYLN